MCPSHERMDQRARNSIYIRFDYILMYIDEKWNGKKVCVTAKKHNFLCVQVSWRWIFLRTFVFTPIHNLIVISSSTFVSKIADRIWFISRRSEIEPFSYFIIRSKIRYHRMESQYNIFSRCRKVKQNNICQFDGLFRKCCSFIDSHFRVSR